MNKEFDEQLAQEAIEKIKEESSQENTRKDDDGTEYEWDDQKQAWFPKIDEDFIAKYQMNYGSTSSSNDKDVEPDATQTEYSQEETEKYWKQYYDYYYSYYQQYSQSSRDVPGDEAGADETIDRDEEYKRYLDYYAYYYGGNQEVEITEEKKGGGNDEGKDKSKKTAEKRKAPEPPKWFDIGDGKNTNVYVSGLPSDITDQEFSEMMNKCGLIMYDPRTRKPKLKLYRDENGQPKGDGRCCYIKKESVDLAMQILDGSDIRGNTVRVETAKFEMKGAFDASKCKKKLSNKEKKKMKEKQEKLFDWHPDKLVGQRPNNEKVIILKNMFDPKEFETNPVLITDLRNDIRDECGTYGDIKKLVLFDRHDDGVVMVFYKEAADADNCKQSLNGRWFAKRRIIAATWDGKTNYDVEETDEERQKRLSQWRGFLDQAEDSSDPSLPKADTVPVKPDAISPKPDAISPKLDAISPKPDAISPKPDDISPKRDEISPKLEIIPGKPDMVSPTPDTIPAKPDSIPGKADSIPAKPDEISSKLSISQSADTSVEPMSIVSQESKFPTRSNISGVSEASPEALSGNVVAESGLKSDELMEIGDDSGIVQESAHGTSKESDVTSMSDLG